MAPLRQTLRARPVTPPVRITLLLLKIAAGNSHLATDLQPWSDQLETWTARVLTADTLEQVLR